MKVAVITDTHYGARKGSKYLHDHFELFYKNVFFPSLKEHGVEAVIHMGDAFDSRKSIDYQSLEWAKRVVFEHLKKYDVHMIIGNHDCYYKNTNSVNSPSLLLQTYSNIKTYSSPQTMDWIRIFLVSSKRYFLVITTLVLIMDVFSTLVILMKCTGRM